MQLKESQKEQLWNPIAEFLIELELELFDLNLIREKGSLIFRVTIDKPAGITLEDCGYASQLISDFLDQEDPFDFEYQLEVSSPGIFRKLKQLEDLPRYFGELVRITFKTGNKKRKDLTGTLIGLENSTVIIEDSRKSSERILWDKIKKIQLYPNL